MSKASDNVFPRFLISEGGSTSTPAAGRVTVYAKADGLLYSKDDAGVETLVSGGAGGGSVATDAIWDAAGDLAVGSGANTAARLAIGAAGGHLSRVNGAVAWNSGTSFPTAATGDRYWRTDLGIEAYYDGTRWLSTQLFTTAMPPTAFFVNSGTSAMNAGKLVVPFRGVYSLYIVSADVMYNGGTYSATVYWTIKVNWTNAAGTDTQLGTTMDTKLGTTGGNYYDVRIDIGAVLDSTARTIQMRYDAVGGASQLTYSTSALTYRLILT